MNKKNVQLKNTYEILVKIWVLNFKNKPKFEYKEKYIKEILAK
jgi:hypothetical protein